MKTGINLLFVLTFLWTITGCGANTETISNGVAGTSAPIISETIAGDYIIMLFSHKQVYQTDEPVKIAAKLKYVGEKEEMTIYHAASPFWFDIREVSRGIDIDYMMTMPLLQTTLKQDEWYEETYRKTGSYQGEDDSERAQFIKEFLEGESFPAGEYEIELRTDFYTGSLDNEEEKHTYNTSIIIQVVE